MCRKLLQLLNFSRIGVVCVASGALYHFLMAEAASVVAENEPEQNLSDDILGYIFESLPIRSLGAVSSVSRRWREAHNVASLVDLWACAACAEKVFRLDPLYPTTGQCLGHQGIS